jgi:hypothetical protein
MQWVARDSEARDERSTDPCFPVTVSEAPNLGLYRRIVGMLAEAVEPLGTCSLAPGSGGPAITATIHTVGTRRDVMDT